MLSSGALDLLSDVLAGNDAAWLCLARFRSHASSDGNQNFPLFGENQVFASLAPGGNQDFAPGGNQDFESLATGGNQDFESLPPGGNQDHLVRISPLSEIQHTYTTKEFERLVYGRINSCAFAKIYEYLIAEDTHDILRKDLKELERDFQNTWGKILLSSNQWERNETQKRRQPAGKKSSCGISNATFI